MRAPLRHTALIALMLLPATAVAAAASRPATRAPKLTVDRVTVQPGGTLTLAGTGFPRNAHVTLMARPPHGAATRIGGAETGQRGRFVATIHVRPRSSAGRFVAFACDEGCHARASARFRIVAP